MREIPMCGSLAPVDSGSGSTGLSLLQISGFSLFPVSEVHLTLFPQNHHSLPFHCSEEALMVLNFLNIPPCSVTSMFTSFLLFSFMSLRKRDSLPRGLCSSPNLCSLPCPCDSPSSHMRILLVSLSHLSLQTFRLYFCIPV